jgi:hypothetical protein
MNIIVEFIEDTDSVDEIAIALDRFRKTEEVKEEDIEEFLKYIKSTGHQEYEKSFYGEHFEKYSTKLVLRYMDEENLTILRRIEDVLDGKYTVSDAVSILYQNINKNYTPEQMIKADLRCIKDVYDSNGDVIIENGSYLEVKKIDYAADSYLSEFMSMYKSSKLPDYAHENYFIDVYNKIIDGLYVLFQTRTDILEDIKKNFAGIIYDDKIFIDKDNIELYWSNKGRTSCMKDHRLSIRYRIKSTNFIGYVYEGGDVLKEKPIELNLTEDKIFCPIIKSKKETSGLSESYNLRLVLEGRKEDARKKYPNFSDEIFNFYVENDPSGNQKYLDWLLKNSNSDYEAVTDINWELLDIIKMFHQHQNMFVNKDINSHTYNTLDREITDVREKLAQKEEKKQAKKQSFKLYEDERWLAISPKSWQASCYYGAGTKWCVTMKNNSSYWNKYSKNATFIFIIDKTKGQDDPLYKVAYRIIGRSGKYELWNAPDYEISKGEEGLRYFNELPEELKERALKIHQENFPPSEGRPEWIENSPRAQALSNNLNSDEIEDVEDYWYGLSVYEVDGDHYAVGDSSEVDSAIHEYYNDYTDEDLMEYYDYDGYYLSMNDEDSFIDDEVENYVESSSERELLEMSGLDRDMDSIEEGIRDLQYELESEEDPERIDEIEDEISTLEFNKDDLIERAKEVVSNSIRNEWAYCLSDGPVNCLVHERGWFRNARELYKSGLVDLDRNSLLESVVDDADYSVIAPYDYEEEQDDDGNYWYIYKIDY